MKRIIRLTESDLTRIVKRIIKEQDEVTPQKIQDVPEVIVTTDASKYIYNIKLRKPTSDGYTSLIYVIRTGELKGESNKDSVVATIQANQTKEQVTAWLKRNRKLFKVAK